MSLDWKQICALILWTLNASNLYISSDSLDSGLWSRFGQAYEAPQCVRFELIKQGLGPSRGFFIAEATGLMF